jgi:hypothetical protein
MKKYITDMGAPLTLTDTDTGEEIVISRYGVWDIKSGDVIDTGDDLEALQATHGPDLTVLVLPGLRDSA